MGHIDRNGSIHDNATGKFTGHVHTEADAGALLVPDETRELSDEDRALLAPFAGMAGRGYDSGDLAQLQRAMPDGYLLRSGANRIFDLEVRVGEGRWRPISDEFISFLVVGEPGRQAPARLIQDEPQPRFDTSERDWLAQNAGTFVNGYTSDEIDGFGSALHSVKIACVWDGFDFSGFYGDSELFGKVDGGPWRPLSTEAWAYLTEGSDGDPLPEKFLGDDPANLSIDIDTVLAMNRHNYVLNSR